MTEEFNLTAERRKLFEEVLVGKPNGARIYRIILEQDEEFIKQLKEKFSEWIIDEEDLASAFMMIDKLNGV